MFCMFPNNIKECYAAKEAISELYQKDKNWEKCYEATMDIVRTYPEIETNAKYLFNAGNIMFRRCLINAALW